MFRDKIYVPKDRGVESWSNITIHVLLDMQAALRFSKWSHKITGGHRCLNTSVFTWRHVSYAIEQSHVRGHPSVSLSFLSSTTLLLFICISPTPLYHLQGPHPKPMTFVFKVRWLSRCWLTESHSFLRSYLNSIRHASDALGQVCVTLHMWIAI
jgi:hypothetical protein